LKSDFQTIAVHGPRSSFLLNPPSHRHRPAPLELMSDIAVGRGRNSADPWPWSDVRAKRGIKTTTRVIPSTAKRAEESGGVRGNASMRSKAGFLNPEYRNSKCDLTAHRYTPSRCDLISPRPAPGPGRSV